MLGEQARANSPDWPYFVSGSVDGFGTSPKTCAAVSGISIGLGARLFRAEHALDRRLGLGPSASWPSREAAAAFSGLARPLGLGFRLPRLLLGLLGPLLGAGDHLVRRSPRRPG